VKYISCMSFSVSGVVRRWRPVKEEE
jgi:hypothetical protein